jgi:uncharacterized lipoprotein YajG
MTKKIITALVLAATFALGGCSMPSTVVRTVDDRPTLAFKGAPREAILFVDGINMGSAAQYDGDPKVLTVETGTHNVIVKVGQEDIFEKRVFVESSLKTITIK